TAAGSAPCATAPSVVLASLRASSGVSFPTAPRVTRRVGVLLPLPARYFTTYDLAPVVCTLTPKPASFSSQRKYSVAAGLSASTDRFVMCPRIPCPPKRNHRGTTET